jgi:hypothetical protein
MIRKSRGRRRAPRFVLENPRHGARDARPTVGLSFMLACLKGVFGALAGARLGLTFAGRTKGNPCASGLGEANGDRLLRRSGSMLTAANFVDLFANEFARLSRGRFAFAPVLAGLFDCSLVRHHHSPIRPIAGTTLVPRGGGTCAARGPRLIAFAHTVNVRGTKLIRTAG